MKKLLAFALVLGMLLSLVTVSALAADEVVKPEKITIMCNATVPTIVNGRDDFEARWEELTGIDLEIIQPDHDAYEDVLQQQIASGDWPDVILLSPVLYSAYASEGVLWDMTDAWENSELANSGRWVGDSVTEGLKINGRLYGFSPTTGNGCLTYIKQAWLDAVGMDAPTTYDEFIAVCDAFVNQDPDGNGEADTYALAAAGFVGFEAPFINYLPNFYQDAYPYFIQLDDGTWVDGFTQPSMQGALERLADAYAKGYIDPTTLTNGTGDCRNKFYDEKTGIFTYWAGIWGTRLKENLEANGHDGTLVALPPIAEVGQYYDRATGGWCITSSCENPEGVYKYFIDTMLDGGDMQMLWTYGVEGTHWSRAAETVLDQTFTEGQFHMLENLENKGTLYTKSHIDPMISLGKFADGYYDPMVDTVKPEAKVSAQVFNANSKVAKLVPTTDVMAIYGADLQTLKAELIAKVAMGEMTFDEAMTQFKTDGGAAWSQAIVDSLNNLD